MLVLGCLALSLCILMYLYSLHYYSFYVFGFGAHSPLKTAFWKRCISCLFCELTSENARIHTYQHLYWALYLFVVLLQAGNS